MSVKSLLQPGAKKALIRIIDTIIVLKINDVNELYIPIDLQFIVVLTTDIRAVTLQLARDE